MLLVVGCRKPFKLVQRRMNCDALTVPSLHGTWTAIAFQTEKQQASTESMFADTDPSTCRHLVGVVVSAPFVSAWLKGSAAMLLYAPLPLFVALL